MSALIARVVEVAEKRLAAWIVSLMMGMGTAGTLLGVLTLDEWFKFPSDWHADKFCFGAVCATWCLGLLLTWSPRPRVASVQVVDGVLSITSRRSVPTQGISVGVARAARGYSVAISEANGKAVFLEVEQESEARALLSRLGVKWPGTGGGMMIMPHQSLRRFRRGVASAGMVFAALYASFVGIMTNSDFKAIFGLPAIGFACLASVLFLMEPIARRRQFIGFDRISGESRIAQHMGLHVLHTLTEDETRTPAQGDDDARSNVLARAAENEPRNAWLARIDAMAQKGTDGYRGDAFSSDELRRIVEDSSTSMDTRLGALRLLTRGGRDALPEEVRARIGAEVGADRVRVVLEEAEPQKAGEALDALGPIFRVNR